MVLRCTCALTSICEQGSVSILVLLPHIAEVGEQSSEHLRCWAFHYYMQGSKCVTPELPLLHVCTTSHASGESKMLQKL